jgi:Flp pilus assembly protein TadD
MALGESDATTRHRRQLAETAIAQATRGEWEAAVATNEELIELGPDVDAYNRLGKALAELGRSATWSACVW